MLTHNLEKSIREMSQNTGLKRSWLITGGPQRQPGTDSCRGAEATVAGCRTVEVSRLQCVWGGYRRCFVGVGRRALSVGRMMVFLSPHQFLKGCFCQTVYKGRALSVTGGDS